MAHCQLIGRDGETLVLRVRDGCPETTEQQALELIARVEDQKLAAFERPQQPREAGSGNPGSTTILHIATLELHLTHCWKYIRHHSSMIYRHLNCKTRKRL